MNLYERSVVIFDYDGTIADTKACIIATATTVLTEWGLSPEELTRVPDLIGPPFPQAYEQVFGFSRADAEEITRRYRAIYTNCGIEAWPAFPGIPELLRDLRAAGKLLTIASSKKMSLVCRGLEDNGIIELFDFVGGKGSDENQDKVEAIRSALLRAGVTPSEAVMVGDRHHDVEAAMKCGVDCIGVLYGDTAEPGELEQAGAMAIAHTVGELRALLLDG